jgi:hypothetical protein
MPSRLSIIGFASVTGCAISLSVRLSSGSGRAYAPPYLRVSNKSADGPAHLRCSKCLPSRVTPLIHFARQSAGFEENSPPLFRISFPRNVQ